MQQFIARQPIFDRDLKVYGYELLFRSGLDNFFDGVDPDAATSNVIANSSLLFSIAEMTEGTRAFINFTRKLFIQDFATILPNSATVAEILEDIPPDEEVLQACRRLKEAGYSLALDDFVYHPDFEPVLDLVDIVKVDFMATSRPLCRELAERFTPRGITMLAEKVETQADVDLAMEMGYRLFQGYFFSKPVVLARRDIPTSKLQALRVLKEVQKEELDFLQLGQIMMGDLSLSYKLLRYVNSPVVGLRVRITSIEHALAMLGETEVRKWISLIALNAMADDKPLELARTSLVRAKCLELIAEELGKEERKTDYFLMGLFSLLDAILDRPLLELLDDLSLAPDVCAALLGEKTMLGSTLNLVVAMERGDWTAIERLPPLLLLEGADLASIYLEAIQWGREVTEP